MLREKERDIITSCCHSVNLLIQKYFPSSLEYLADVVSPIQAHCADIKKRNPKAKTVFIGPCVAKKDESEYYEGVVDAVLTFEELTNWLKSERIELKKETDITPESRARFFSTTGGVLKTMAKALVFCFFCVLLCAFSSETHAFTCCKVHNFHVCYHAKGICRKAGSADCGNEDGNQSGEGEERRKQTADT